MFWKTGLKERQKKLRRCIVTSLVLHCCHFEIRNMCKVMHNIINDSSYYYSFISPDCNHETNQNRMLCLYLAKLW